MERVFEQVDMCVDHSQSPNCPQLLDDEIAVVSHFESDVYAMATSGIFKMEHGSEQWTPLGILDFIPTIGSAMTSTNIGLGVFVKDVFWLMTFGLWHPVCKTFKTRKFPALCYCPKHDCVIISGGQDQHTNILSEFWIVWLESGEVQELKLSQEISRYGHTIVCTDDDTVCVFGGCDNDGMAKTAPLFVNILTGEVTVTDVYCPFPNICYHNSLIIDNRMYCVGGIVNGKKSRDGWIFDIKHQIWFKIGLTGFNSRAAFMVPIKNGFHIFSDNLQQSINVIYKDHETFIDNLIGVNIESQIYQFDEVTTAKDQVKRINDWKKAVTDVLAMVTNDTNTEKVEELNRITADIANVKRSLLAVRSVARKIKREVVTHSEPAKRDSTNLNQMIHQLNELKAKNKEPLSLDKSLYEKLQKGVKRLIKYDKLGLPVTVNRNWEAQVRCSENATFLESQRTKIEQLRSQLYTFPENLDLKSLAEGGRKHTEICREVWNIECDIAKTKSAYADTREKILEKMLEVRRVQDSMNIKHKCLMDDLLKAAEEKNKNKVIMIKMQEEQESLFKTIHDRYQAVISKAARVSAREAGYLAREASKSVESLIKWLNEKAVESGNKDCVNTMKMNERAHAVVRPRLSLSAIDFVADSGDNGWLASTIEALETIKSETHVNKL